MDSMLLASVLQSSIPPSTLPKSTLQNQTRQVTNASSYNASKSFQQDPWSDDLARERLWEQWEFKKGLWKSRSELDLQQAPVYQVKLDTSNSQATFNGPTRSYSGGGQGSGIIPAFMTLLTAPVNGPR